LCCGPYGHPWLERVDDDEESIDGDGRQCQRGSVHAGALGVRNYVAKYLTKHPMACKMVKKTRRLLVTLYYTEKNISSIPNT